MLIEIPRNFTIILVGRVVGTIEIPTKDRNVLETSHRNPSFYVRGFLGGDVLRGVALYAEREDWCPGSPLTTGPQRVADCAMKNHGKSPVLSR